MNSNQEDMLTTVGEEVIPPQQKDEQCDYFTQDPPKPTVLDLVLSLRAAEEEPREPTPRAIAQSPSPPLDSECRVCGDPAANMLHYGAVVCFSCRAFFRRAVLERRSYTCVRGTFGCAVDAVTRTNCKRCRLAKCLRVGLNPRLVDSNKRKVTYFGSWDATKRNEASLESVEKLQQNIDKSKRKVIYKTVFLQQGENESAHSNLYQKPPEQKYFAYNPVTKTFRSIEDANLQSAVPEETSGGNIGTSAMQDGGIVKNYIYSPSNQDIGLVSDDPDDPDIAETLDEAVNRDNDTNVEEDATIDSRQMISTGQPGNVLEGKNFVYPSGSQTLVSKALVESYEKSPNYERRRSFRSLIIEVLQESTSGKLKLADIYKRVAKKCPIQAQKSSFENSIRHNLSLHKEFILEFVHGPGAHGGHWKLDPNVDISKLMRSTSRKHWVPNRSGSDYVKYEQNFQDKTLRSEEDFVHKDVMEINDDSNQILENKMLRIEEDHLPKYLMDNNGKVSWKVIQNKTLADEEDKDDSNEVLEDETPRSEEDPPIKDLMENNDDFNQIIEENFMEQIVDGKESESECDDTLDEAPSESYHENVTNNENDAKKQFSSPIKQAENSNSNRDRFILEHGARGLAMLSNRKRGRKMGKHDKLISLKMEKGFKSYRSLIIEVLLESKSGKLKLQEIYRKVLEKCPELAGKGVENSIRHNLSLYKEFIIDTTSKGDGKGGLWMIDPNIDMSQLCKREVSKKFEYLRRKMPIDNLRNVTPKTAKPPAIISVQEAARDSIHLATQRGATVGLARRNVSQTNHHPQKKVFSLSEARALLTF